MASIVLDDFIIFPVQSTYCYGSGFPIPVSADTLGDWDLLSVSTMSGDATPDLIVLPQFQCGITLEDFLYDFYYHIYVFPNLMELRNPRKNVDIPFVVWNAYPYDNQLNSIVVTDGDGLTLDVAAPSVFYGIEYRTVNLQIENSAPLEIDSSFTFNFNEGSGIFLFKATLANILATLPDIPVQEVWQWLTDVMVTRDGTEQRVALRLTPRRKLNTKLIQTTVEEIRATLTNLAFDCVSQIVIPYYQYSTALTEVATVSDNTVWFNANMTDLREGEYVYILSSAGGELNKVTTLNATNAVLESPLGLTHPKGGIICPAYVSLLKDKTSISRYSVNNVSELEINTTVSVAREYFSRPESAATINTFDSYPILDKLPLANDNVEDTFDTGFDDVDYETGAIERIANWDFTKVEGIRQFRIHRYNDYVTMDWWRDFLELAEGRCNPFLVPTFRPDLVLAEAPSEESSALIFEGTTYATLYSLLEPYKRLYLFTANGNICVEVDSAEAQEDGTSLISLVDKLPVGAGYTQINQVSFLLKCRLGSDEVTLTHYGLDTLLELTLRTVPE